MKGIIAVVMLAVGVVLGFTAGLVIRDPSVVAHPRSLLQNDAPAACGQVISAAEDLSRINRGYLSLVRNGYLPMLRQRNTGQAPTESVGGPGAPSAEAAVGAMLDASQRLADLGDQTAVAAAKLNESKVECHARVGR